MAFYDVPKDGGSFVNQQKEPIKSFGDLLIELGDQFAKHELDSGFKFIGTLTLTVREQSPEIEFHAVNPGILKQFPGYDLELEKDLTHHRMSDWGGSVV